MAVCIVRRWRKRDGDLIGSAEPLVDIEVDGASLVVKSNFSGVLSVYAPAGKRIVAGEVLATVEPIDGEAIYDVVMPEMRVGPVMRLRRLFGAR